MKEGALSARKKATPIGTVNMNIEKVNQVSALKANLLNLEDQGKNPSIEEI